MWELVLGPNVACGPLLQRHFLTDFWASVFKMEKMILDDCYVMGGARTITLDNSPTRKLTGKLQILQMLQTTTRKVAVWAVFEAGFSWKTSIDCPGARDTPRVGEQHTSTHYMSKQLLRWKTVELNKTEEHEISWDNNPMTWIDIQITWVKSYIKPGPRLVAHRLSTSSSYLHMQPLLGGTDTLYSKSLLHQ